MKRYPILYLPSAERDLIAVLDYVSRESAAGAARILDELDKAIQRLGRFPESGAVPKDKSLKSRGYRFIVVENYLVFYRFEKKQIVVYRVLHGKRRYEFLFG
ncbi:MAG: type II toxin-antitoxin system RelE/ParE family toxin [Deltaproteobacteria bacterium]|nr:type II toxin-antitoxin system RelE/ParE family toxin [Deltaproteobacteria bacterium]